MEISIQKIDNILMALYEDNKFNGSKLLGKDGDILYSRSFGVSDYRTSEKLNRNSQFKIFSITSQFTSMAIMMLQERGMLNFDDAVQDYLVDFPYADIAIGNLLTQTSGLPDHDFLWQYNEERPVGIDNPGNVDLLNWR